MVYYDYALAASSLSSPWCVDFWEKICLKWERIIKISPDFAVPCYLGEGNDILCRWKLY